MRKRYQAVVLFAGANIYKNRRPATKYEEKCDEHATRLMIEVIIVVALVIVAFNLIFLGLIYVYVFKGVYVTPTGAILPFVDPMSIRGYIINQFIQFATAIEAVPYCLALEVLACMLNNTYVAMADLTCFNMQTFSVGLRGSGHFTEQQKREFRNVIVKLQDLEAYLAELNSIYYWKFFLQPILTTICVSIGIFAQMTVSENIAQCPQYEYNVSLTNNIRMNSHPDMALHCLCTLYS